MIELAQPVNHRKSVAWGLGLGGHYSLLVMRPLNLAARLVRLPEAHFVLGALDDSLAMACRRGATPGRAAFASIVSGVGPTAGLAKLACLCR